jgi:anthranilate phosphoribosyltransferase
VDDQRRWPLLISALLRAQNLSTADTAWAMSKIIAGEATSAQIAAFTIALRAKGETLDEIVGLVKVMLDHVIRLELPENLHRSAVDIIGSGGDGQRTVNVSTMAAIVVSAAGIPVIKAGNRATSSLCGAADVLEALGIPMDLAPSEVARCIMDAGIGFCFAPKFNPGMRHAAMTRREMGVPTVFNFIGPLVNPAQPTAALAGCSDLLLAPLVAEVFARRGHSVLVVRGEDGLDEFTTTSPTRIWAVRANTVTEVVIDAGILGIPRATLNELRGGDPSFNAAATHSVLAGKHGPIRDIVLLNAAAALAAREGWGDDLTGALKLGLERAAYAVDSGKAATTLSHWATAAVRGNMS